MADFLEVNADLHIHGCYAAATSEKMIPRIIGQQAPLKGIDLLGTADILNAKWMKLIKEQLRQVNDSVLEHENGTKFILQTEIEDKSRTHQLIYFPSFSKVEEVRERFKKHCKDLDADGRPKIALGGEEIAQICADAECMLGFAHAFTPYFGLFAHYASYKTCYGKLWKNIPFMELGLSADTNMADRISELHKLTFISCSDGHSPWPNKLGREFTKFLLQDVTFEELKKAMFGLEGRKATLNVKFNPLEGKYHKTRCTGCLTFFNLRDAQTYRWRCPSCRSTIKKGVSDRIEELADLKPNTHPDNRPRCIHIIPLSEIIAIAVGTKQTYSEKVQSLWRKFVERFGNEISVLIDVPIEELAEIEKHTATLIDLFRNDKFDYVPGGAGEYGIPTPPGKKAEMKIWRNGRVEKVPVGKTFGEEQKSITDFF